MKNRGIATAIREWPPLATVRKWLRRIFRRDEPQVELPNTTGSSIVMPAAPPVEVAAPPVEVAAPPVEVAAPPAEAAAPPAEVAAPPAEVVAPPAEAADKKKHNRRARATRAKRDRTQVPPHAETFSELLESLDETFDGMRVPTMKNSWLPKEDVQALHKLGVYIPSPWSLEVVKEPSIPKDVQLPSMASALIGSSKYATKDSVRAHFAFAMKEPVLPRNVQKICGTPFRFGLCYRPHKDWRVKSGGGMAWVWAWIVVRPDGVISCPRELRNVPHTIIHRRSQNGCRHSTVQLKEWRVPTLMMLGHNEPAEQERYLLCVFRQLILWWVKREERWSVAIRRDDHRAIFSIAPEHTAHYFADREKQVTVDGRAKKIIHYVRPHVRSNGVRVREHVRGLSHFDWHGFQCSVTAPKLNGYLFTDCPVAPVLVDERLACTDDEYLKAEEFAGMLADSEDFGPSILRPNPGVAAG